MAALLSQAFNLATSLALARMMGAQGLGELAIILTTVSACGVLGGAGLAMTATRHVAAFREIDPERGSRILALTYGAALGSGGTASLLLLLLGRYVATRVLHAPHLTGAMRVGSALVLLNALGGVQAGALAGFEAFATMAHISLIRGIITLSLVTAGALLWGVTGAVAALVVAAIIAYCLNELALRQRYRESGLRLRYSGSWAERSVLWTFSVPAALGALFFWPANLAASTMLIRKPNGYFELGLLTVAQQLRSLVLFVPAALAQVTLPAFSSLRARANPDGVRSALKSSLLVCGLTSTVIATVLTLVSHPILGLYGPDFRRRRAILILLVWSAVLTSVETPMEQLIISSGMLWFNFLASGLWALTLLTSAEALLRYGWGATGVAFAYLGAAMAQVVLVAHRVFLLAGRDAADSLAARGRPMMKGGVR